MYNIRSLIENLGIFKRNKVPLELKILGLAFYIQFSSLRRAARALSEVHEVSKTAVWKWVKRLREKLNIKPYKTHRRLIALDETCIKVAGFEYWVYTALDLDRNEIISMKVSPFRSSLTARLFIEDTLRYCDGRPSFVVNGAPWLEGVLKELGLKCEVKSFRR
jgi:putative transposase